MSVDVAQLPSASDWAWSAELHIQTGNDKEVWEQDLGVTGTGAQSLPLQFDTMPTRLRAVVEERGIAHVFVRLLGRGLSGEVRQKQSLPVMYMIDRGAGFRLYTLNEAEAAGLDTSMPAPPKHVSPTVDEIALLAQVPPKRPQLDLDAEDSTTPDGAPQGGER